MVEPVQPRRLSTPTPPTEPPTGSLVPIRRPVSDKAATTSRTSKQPEYRPGSIAGVVGELRDVAEREIKATGKVVQNLPASMTKFFGGLAIDATWGLGRSILYGGGKSPISIGSEYVPKTMNETAESFVNTVKVWERIPEYWETMEAGGAIAPMLIEDLGNLSILGRGVRAPIKATAATATRRAQGATQAATLAGTSQEAAKAATRAARLSTIADRANKLTSTSNRVIHYTDKAGNFPFMPYVWAGKGLGKAVREGTYVEGIGGWGAKAAQAYISQIDALRQAEPNIDPQDPRLKDLTTKANRNLRLSLSHSTRQQIRQAVRNASHEQNAVSKAVSNIAQNPLLKDEINPATGEVWGELSPAENQAIISVLNGRAALIKGLSERLGITPDRLAELGKYDETPEYWLSPEGATLAMDFIEGRLTPEHYDRLSNALDLLAKQVIMNTQQAVEGFGRRNLLSPDYLVPLPFVNKLKQAVMQSKNGQLIELWLALEEAGLLIPLSQALETFTPEQLKLREEAMVAFVQNLPDELALDPSMYPANMRENIEFYRRVRRSLNQRATGAAVKEPIPPVDGRPRAPQDPFFPFEEDVEAGIEAPTGPEQFPMPRSRGKIDAAETMLGKAAQKIEKLREKVIEIADKIADLEVKQAKLEERVRKYDIVDAYLAGMEPKAIARRFRLSINDVNKIIQRSQLARQVSWVKYLQESMDALTKTIGVKRAALRGAAADAELLALEEQYATLLREATNAQKAVQAATSMNEIARLADESAIERLTEEMDLAEDQLLDRETEYEDAGGDINDLRVNVDPKDPEVGPVSPEIAETYLNNLTGLVEDISVKFGSDPIGPVLSRSVEVLNQAWNQAIDFYESASTDAQTLVGELRLQQLSDLIADVTETINQLITEPQEGVLLEQAIADTLVNLVNDPRSQQIIAGTAPFVSRLDRNIKPLLPEGMEMPTIEGGPSKYWDRAQKIDVFDYTPKFDPSNITGSIFKLVTETLQESNNYDKAVEFEYRILRDSVSHPDVTIAWEPTGGSIDFGISTENLLLNIVFDSTDSLSIDQIRETLDGLKQEAEAIDLESEFLTEPEVYLTGDGSYYLISERGSIGNYKQFLESYNQLNNIFDQIFSPEGEAVAGTAPTFTGVKSMMPEGSSFGNYGSPRFDRYNYLPSYDPINITGSFFEDLNTVIPVNTISKKGPVKSKSINYDTDNASRSAFVRIGSVKANSDGSAYFELLPRNDEGAFGDFTIYLDDRNTPKAVSASEIYKAFDELAEDIKSQVNNPTGRSSSAVAEIDIDLDNGSYIKLEMSIDITDALTALEIFERDLAKVIGPRGGVEAVASPTGPRLRAIDEMIEASAPLPDPELEAIAQQMAEDPTLLDDMAPDVEDYRSVTQSIEELRNPTPEAIEAFRAQAIEAAQQELNTSLGLLENLGGLVTGNNVTFRINVRRGTPEWDWWEQLDPDVRRNIARKYFRSDKIKSTAAKGPRTVQSAFNIDQIAADVNLDVETWAEQFLEGIRLHEQAQRNLKETKSGEIDAETFVRENPELQEAIAYRDRLEEEGVDQATVDAYDRARVVRAERQDADIPNDPLEVRPDPVLVNPGVRAAAYEADVLVAMAKEATAKMRRAESASKRLEAFQEYLSDYNARVEAEGNVLRLRNVARNARISLDKNLERQRKLRDKARGAKAEIKNTVALQNRLTGDESFDLIGNMPGAVPLEIALEGGYPSEQFSVDVPIGPRDARTVEPVTLQGPMYLPTGRPRPFTGGLSTEVLKAGLPGFDKLTSEHFRDGDRQTIFSIRLLADRMGKEARMMTENEAYRAIVAQFGDTAVDLIGREESFALYEKAYQMVSNMSESSQIAFAASVLDEAGEPVVNLLPKVDGIGAYASGVPDPRAVFNLALREQYGRLIAQEMQFRGYAAVDPYKRIGGVVPFDQITHESMFLPVGLREQIALREAIVDPNGFNAFLKGAHRVTSFMKSTTLVLSVAWQLGDLYSNIVIAQMTGVDVPDMIRQMRRVKVEEYGTGWAGFKAMIDPRTEAPTPTATVRIAQESPIQDIGFSQAERAFLRGMPVEEPTPLLSRVSRGRLQYPERVRGRSITKVSFKINETINRISRHAYFLELLERRLQEQGRTLDEVAADGSWRTDPQTKKLVFQVADTANDWLGDFADLSMAERKYMVPFFPFYSWTKHIHKVFLMMGREHPQSLRWYIYLGTLNFDPDEDPMNLRYGNPSVFGGAVNLNPFNPFADVFAGPAASLISEQNIQPALSQLGPVPRLVGGAFGFDVTKARPLQRPPGSGEYTESGLEQLTGLWRDPREALGFGLMQFPIAARALNILPGERIPGTQIALGPVTRYQTGEARLKPGTERRIERPGGRAAAVGRLFSVPLIPYQSDEQIDEVMRSAKRRLKTVERLKKRRERYLRSLDD